MTVRNIKFESFLETGGANVLPVTNPWEVARFRTPRGVHVVYRNNKGNLSYSDLHASAAYRAFHDGKKWVAAEKVKRRSRRYLETAIRQRDGDGCFFCPHPFTEENPSTIEHLLAVACGGSNALSNLALAHKHCNHAAADLAVTQKVAIREKNYGGKNGTEA